MGKLKSKKGAASFYVIAFSTLILLIIVASFTALVIAQITRSSNADLAQSAYDSALAGVEDAKLAFYDYQNCLKQGATAKVPDNDGSLTCDEIVYIMEETNSCDMVSYVLGRLPYGEINEGGVIIKESKDGGGNNMSQAYTCTKLEMSLKDYRATLSAANQMKITRVKFDNVSANDIARMRVSWGVNTNESQANYSNIGTFDGHSVVRFPEADQSTNVADPPTIAVALVQAGESYSFDSFSRVEGDQTNRGMVFLVPTDNKDVAKSNMESNYIGGYKGDEKGNYLTASAIVKSNNQSASNLPYVVYCSSSESSDDELMCSVDIELPEPIGGVRGDDNFLVAVSLPYGKPNTDVVLEFFCKEGATCGETATGETTSQANMKGVQIAVDSTGRASDLFRRVETRLEAAGEGGLLSIMGPLELFGGNGNGEWGGSSYTLNKDYVVTCEWNFADSANLPGCKN